MLADGKYRYTEDLLVLEACRGGRIDLPGTGQRIITPLVADRWREALQAHPDKAYTEYVVAGIQSGFHIGFNHREQGCKAASSNMLSAQQYPEPVAEYLATELRADRVVEVPAEGRAAVQISRFGVIPKANQPGKWRLILDLSSPEGMSVNDGISPERCSIAFATVDAAMQKLVQLGPGTQMAKVDVEHAYRNVPVHPEDRSLLGMQWKGLIYVDTVLPFGLRSAPKIFSALADALEWILKKFGVSHLQHYLDDFLTMGQADTNECQSNLDKVIAICAWLGIPLKTQKIEGPSVSIIFLGIELDTIAMEARLPREKLMGLLEELRQWKGRRHCQKRNLLSLIGKLSHACKVVVAGRIFLRRMIEQAKSVRRLRHYIHLTAEFHSDLAWWSTFLEQWNGRSMLQVHGPQTPPEVVIATDASGAWGGGAVWEKHWLQCQWDSSWMEQSIAAKELVPIALAVAVWGPQWRHKCVAVQCDNMAVVQVLNAQNCKDPTLLHLLRCIHFYTALLDIRIWAKAYTGGEK